MNPYHCQLDQVSGRSLQRRVLSIPLSVRPLIEVSLLNFRDVAATLEERLHVALLARQFHLAVEESPHSRKALEVTSYEVPRVLQGDPQLPAQGEGPLTVNGCEIDCFRPAPHVAADLEQWNVEDQRCGLAVDISALSKGVNKSRIFRQMGHDAQLDLRIIRHKENPSLTGNETGPDGLSPGCSDRNVLKVWLSRAQAAGRSTCLVEAGVNSPRQAVDALRERVDIGALELLKLAVFQDKSWELVPHCRELLQDVSIGGGARLRLFQHRQLMFLEQDGGKLTGRVEIEIRSGDTSDLLVQSGEVGAQLVAQPPEEVPIDGDTAPLHVDEHVKQGHLNVL